MISKIAKWEPVPSIDDGPRPHLNKAVVLHTAVSDATDLRAFWASGAAGPGVGAHFYVNKQGEAFQYVDTARKTGHAFAANDFAVGIETWDGGDPLQNPWNPLQLATLIALCQEMGVPGKGLKETPSDGVGYHREYPSWNLSGHTCPGDLRVAQVPTIITALGGGSMATEAQKEQDYNIGSRMADENYLLAKGAIQPGGGIRVWTEADAAKISIDATVGFLVRTDELAAMGSGGSGAPPHGSADAHITW